MCYFTRIPSKTFHIAKKKKNLPLLSRFAYFLVLLWFSFVKYFFALSQLVFKWLFYFNFFVILNYAIKVTA